MVTLKKESHFIGSQITKHKHLIQICKRHFSHFDNQYGRIAEAKLEEHDFYCNENQAEKVMITIQDPILKNY